MTRDPYMHSNSTVRHYHWAGLDFMVDRHGTPVLIEANKSSHMLGEYLQFVGDERPFELTAGVMNRAGGIPCLLWRRDDPLPDADEDACFIGRFLEKHLDRPPVVCNVEDNQQPRNELVSRDGRLIRTGSIFRWWYGLPWSFERAGVTVINPNALWVTVRDKLNCYRILEGADPVAVTTDGAAADSPTGWRGLTSGKAPQQTTPADDSQNVPPSESINEQVADIQRSRPTQFRVPQAFAVQSLNDVRRVLQERAELFKDGYVLKPRVAWGGAGAQIANPGEEPLAFEGQYLLSERIIPPDFNGQFWEVRVFVMAGVYLGGIKHVSTTPNTNYWQGGRPQRLDDELTARLEHPALEAVRLLDAAAERIHKQTEPPRSELTNVDY
jgi:hypothetical protein